MLLRAVPVKLIAPLVPELKVTPRVVLLLFTGVATPKRFQSKPLRTSKRGLPSLRTVTV